MNTLKKMKIKNLNQRKIKMSECFTVYTDDLKGILSPVLVLSTHQQQYTPPESI